MTRVEYRLIIPCMDTPPISTGDIVLFSGRGIVSQSIRWRTWSKYSHCGLVCWVTPEHIRTAASLWSASWIDRTDYLCDWLGCGKWLCFESTTLSDLPCAITGEAIHGVQAHELQVRVDRYDGAVCYLPWRERFRLTEEEQHNLALRLLVRIGTPYDARMAALAGSCLLKYIWPYDAADRSSVFCAAMCGRQIGLLSPGMRLPLKSPSRWTPGGLYRTTTKTERVDPPVGIQKTKGV